MISTHCLGFVSVFSTHTILRTSKSIGNNTMKKMLLATAGPAYYRMCAQQTFTVQNKPAAVAPKETITHHFFVSGIGRRKLSMQPNFGGAENDVLKQKQQTFVNGLLGFFITLGIYTPLEARVCAHNNCMSCHRYGQLYLHCSLIYFWVPSSCFCIVISLSLRVK